MTSTTDTSTTTTTTPLKILFNNSVLQGYTGDLSSCLANCSNQGICVLDSQNKFKCQCSQFRAGASCQSDTRPCASSPCLNNGTCSNMNNFTSFECTCQNELFYGRFCENKLDLCLNSTSCIKDQGYCQMNGSQPICKCFLGYFGIKCEMVSASLIIRKSMISAATLIAIIIMVCYAITILCFDFTKYFLFKKKDKIQKKPEIRRFHYKP